MSDQFEKIKIFGSCPGKAFLLGEYLALSQDRAVLLNLPNRFELRHLMNSNYTPGAQAPASVEGYHSRTGLGFYDPFREMGALGGFGSSSAELILWKAHADRTQEWDWKKLWLEFRALHAKTGLSLAVMPSGYDVVSQWVGGMLEIHLKKESIRLLTMYPQDVEFWIFHRAGWSGSERQPTHEHLNALTREGVLQSSHWIRIREQAIGVVDRALEYWQMRKLSQFGEMMTFYAELMSQAGFESEEAKLFRQKASRYAGVLGAKGSGALLHDLGILLVESSFKAELETKLSSMERALGARRVTIVSESGAGHRCDS